MQTPFRQPPRRSPLTVGVDIGGTKVLAGVVDRDGTVLTRLRQDTPGRSSAPAAVEEAVVEVVRRLVADHRVGAVGIGAAGFVDAARATVRFSPHLSWRDEPLRASLMARLRMPVIVENDANAALWAEYRFGAARGRRQALCVTLGTGIGGALLVDGKVARGGQGMAGEFGHMRVVPDGHRCECGNRGCWEQYSSGNALAREGRELVASASPVAHRLRELSGGDPAAVTGQLVTEAAREGDPAATELLAEAGRWLGVGLADLAAAFDPDCVVVGGGVCEAGDLLLAPARAALAAHLTGRGFRREPQLVRAELGPDAGFVGAADLARSAVVGRSRRSARRARGRSRPRRRG